MKTFSLLALGIILVACQPSPAMIQRAIEQTQAAWTPTPNPLPFPTSYSDISNQRWRLAPPPESIEFIYDEDADPYFEEVIFDRAKELKITPPYHWEAYYLPGGYAYRMLENHYQMVTRDSNYRLVINNYSADDGGGILSFKQSPMIIDIEFWDATQQISRPRVIVIYKNF